MWRLQVSERMFARYPSPVRSRNFSDVDSSRDTDAAAVVSKHGDSRISLYQSKHKDVTSSTRQGRGAVVVVLFVTMGMHWQTLADMSHISDLSGEVSPYSGVVGGPST